MTRRRRVAAAVAAGLLLAGCSAPAQPPLPAPPPTPPSPVGATPTRAASSPTPAAAPIPPTLTRFYRQPLSWRSCGELQCATASVPMDYARPAGGTLTLALTRRPATSATRKGTLFVNPGGPGGSGIAFAAAFDPTGLADYDILGGDPRGVGRSGAVRCLDGAEADAYLALDLSPDTPAEEAALLAGARAFGEACVRASGAVIGHLSAAENARDLDILRALVGDERLSYLGQSYGTMLGAHYAELFPGRVGRMVLDAAVDVTGTGVPQVVGFERGLRAFAGWCAGRSCRWGTSPEEVLASITALVDRLDARPLAVGGRPLTQSLAVTGVAGLLYGGSAAWPLLDAALGATASGDGSALLAVADRLTGRGPDGRYGDLFAAFQAITCADEPRVTVAVAERRWAAERAAAPFFGRLWGPQVVCASWPVPSAPAPVIDAEGAPPILVVGASGDPVTPYENAVRLAHSLDSGVLLTYGGDGHVAYGRSACVTEAVRTYLNRGTPPAPGATCPGR